jgi:hypothetical protein
MSRAVLVAISSTTARSFAASVAPVATRSTIQSARPTCGASSADPATLTISTWMPRRVLRRDLEAAQVAVLVERALERFTRRRDHEPARAEAQVCELEHARGRFHEHVLADDADVRGATLDVRRDVAGSGEHVLDVAARHDQAPIFAQTRNIKADRAQPGERVG